MITERKKLAYLKFVDVQHSFGNECSEPNAKIGGHHVHETETCHSFVSMKSHFRIVEDKVQLQHEKGKKQIEFGELK